MHTIQRNHIQPVTIQYTTGNEQTPANQQASDAAYGPIKTFRSPDLTPFHNASIQREREQEREEGGKGMQEKKRDSVHIQREGHMGKKNVRKQ